MLKFLVKSHGTYILNVTIRGIKNERPESNMVCHLRMVVGFT